jgi:hypothetical protein
MTTVCITSDDHPAGLHHRLTEMIKGMPVYRSTVLPWLLLILAGVVALLGSGDLSARETGDRMFVWLVVAAIIAAIQCSRPPSRPGSQAKQARASAD